MKTIPFEETNAKREKVGDPSLLNPSLPLRRSPPPDLLLLSKDKVMGFLGVEMFILLTNVVVTLFAASSGRLSSCLSTAGLPCPCLR